MDVHKWIQTHKLTTLTQTNGTPSLVKAIVGKNVPGNWWSHRKAHIIYNYYQDLLESDKVLTLKLINTKTTFVYIELWPLLLGIVLDKKWRGKALIGLNQNAKNLLKLVQSRRVLSVNTISKKWESGKLGLKKARMDLERRGLVLSRDEHTDTGTHTAVLESWKSFQLRKDIHCNKEQQYTVALKKIKDMAGGADLSINPKTKTN